MRPSYLVLLSLAAAGMAGWLLVTPTQGQHEHQQQHQEGMAEQKHYQGDESSGMAPREMIPLLGRHVTTIDDRYFGTVFTRDGVRVYLYTTGRAP